MEKTKFELVEDRFTDLENITEKYGLTSTASNIEKTIQDIYHSKPEAWATMSDEDKEKMTFTADLALQKYGKSFDAVCEDYKTRVQEGKCESQHLTVNSIIEDAGLIDFNPELTQAERELVLKGYGNVPFSEANDLVVMDEETGEEKPALQWNQEQVEFIVQNYEATQLDDLETFVLDEVATENFSSDLWEATERLKACKGNEAESVDWESELDTFQSDFEAQKAQEQGKDR